MAARGPPGARGLSNRFAQFKLVLLGESAVGKVSFWYCVLPSVWFCGSAVLRFCGSVVCVALFDEADPPPLQSSIVLRFVKDQFDSYRESTIGAAFLTQTISLDETTTVKFEIWDTAGQERYKSLAPMYYRNANCAVVVYDITQAVGPPPSAISPLSSRV